MEQATRPSDVQYLNLNFLLTIQVNLKRDFIATSYKFHLDHASAEKLAGMSFDALQLLASNMPHESLFQPIGNFTALLDAPPGLAMMMCSVGTRRTAEQIPAPSPARELKPALN